MLTKKNTDEIILSSLDFKTYYKNVISQNGMVLTYSQTLDPWNRKVNPEMDPHMYTAKLIFSKIAKIFQRRKDSILQQLVLEKILANHISDMGLISRIYT